uniref:Uncharacterized protein n=1 Tax=Musa acuminata subsp. malaccensis TaxID=214687 RepID=A0A804J739_MUSAM
MIVLNEGAGIGIGLWKMRLVQMSRKKLCKLHCHFCIHRRFVEDEISEESQLCFLTIFNHLTLFNHMLQHFYVLWVIPLSVKR